MPSSYMIGRLFPVVSQSVMQKKILLFIIKYSSIYVIVGIDKENYGFPKTCTRKSNLVIIVVWKTIAINLMWSMYSKKFENTFEYLKMHSKSSYNLKKIKTTRLLSACQPAIRPTSIRCMSTIYKGNCCPKTDMLFLK